MRIMLRTWLRVSECVSLCPADPPIISLRPEVTGNKVKRGREVHIPDDLVECDQRQLFLPPNDNYFCLFSSCW